VRRAGIVLLALALLAGACGDDDDDTTADTAPDEVTIRLVTHDSFSATETVLDAFTEETGIKVEIVPQGDAGAALNASILSKDDPLGDVFFGVDNTFLTRALDEDLFVPYESPALEGVDEATILDDEHRVTPIDHSQVCVNYDKEAFTDTPPPVTFDDLPAFAGQLAIENPATSSPGLAFLVATIAHYGEGGWQDWWRQLADGGVTVSNGWEEAYYGEFSGGAGEGTHPLVVSYSTSPPAEVYFADPQPAEAPTGVAEGTCFEQIEMAGILRGTEHEEEAQQLVDFLLSPEFQADMPLNMFVFPVVEDIELPEVFVEHAAVIEEPLSLTPEEIAEHRDRWIEEWTDIVLG
jgi:thiamine transport system substrate-binding protein